MLKKLTIYLEKILALIKPFGVTVMSRLRALKDQVFAMYWDLTPDNRQRVRLVAFAVAILALGFLVGRITNVNRVVDIEKAEKVQLKVEKSGAIEIKLPDLKLNPAIYHFQVVQKAQVPEDIKVPGRLAFNAEKSKVLSARIPGRVERIYAFEGALVQTGSPIVELYSPEFLSAQQEFLLATKTTQVLSGKQSLSDVLGDAQITVQAASNRLRNLGASDQDIQNLNKTEKGQVNLIMRSPLQGVVVKRNVDPGAFVNSGDIVATLADPKQLWFLGNVYEQDMRLISRGQKLVLRTEAYPDKEFIAYANYIAPSIDPVTRALLIRCDVDNSAGLLRPDMYVSAKLTTGMAEAYILPQTAIIRVRETKYVIMRIASDTFRRVPVKGYDIDSKSFAVTEGLIPNANVLTDGAVLLNDRFARQEE
ncbi:MAG: efflux RND transporter periplasmic adaptor subunit [Polynucleobacter sp.]|nr:efflux RND transporter periplasmic adaptor subunit [Polynucleobacter sp.]